MNSFKKVDTFYVYSQDEDSPEGERLRKFLKKEGNFVKWFSEQGPCSNFGFEGFRPETEEEILGRENDKRDKEIQKQESKELAKKFFPWVYQS